MDAGDPGPWFIGGLITAGLAVGGVFLFNALTPDPEPPTLAQAVSDTCGVDLVEPELWQLSDGVVVGFGLTLTDRSTGATHTVTSAPVIDGDLQVFVDGAETPRCSVDLGQLS